METEEQQTSSGAGRQTSVRPGRRLPVDRMTIFARLLPLAAIAAWAVMIWVPFLDSRTTTGPGIVYTSLGELPLSGQNLMAEFLLVWGLIGACAMTAWMFNPLRTWSVVTFVVGVALIVFLLAMVLDPPILMWDGQDEQGRPTGGMAVGYPAPGSIFWALGSCALIAAGICGLIGGCRRRR